MAEESKIWLDGKLVPESEARLSVFDHGLLYGDGIFEGIRFYKGRVFRLEEHLRRLFDSARAILLKMPWTLEEITQFTLETIRANGLRDGYVRLVVTRGAGSLGLNPFLCKQPSLFIIASAITLYDEKFYREGLKIITCATRRNTPAALSPQVKSLNYLNNVMAKVEAMQAGCQEGIMLNEQGYVAECTGDNVFVVRDGQIFTPPVSDGSLNGITRAVMFELCEKLGFRLTEKSLTRYDLYCSEEIFLTGTAAEVIPVVDYDSRPIGSGQPGEITQHLIAAYRELVESEGTDI